MECTGTEARFKRVFCEDYYIDLQELSDGKLLTEDGHEFNIHKIVLAQSSLYFFRLFCGIGKGKKEFSIPGIKGEVLSNVLAYIYSGNGHLNESNVSGILIAADYLLLDSLVNYIKDIYMRDNLSTHNCMPLLRAALHINQMKIMMKSYRFVQTHFEIIVETEDSELGCVSLEILKRLLCDKSLCVRNENTVFLAITKWIEADATYRQPQVPKLLSCLAISDVDEELATIILEHPIVANNPFCQEMKEIKTKSSFTSNLQNLQNYIKRQSKFDLALCNTRVPDNIYFVAHYCVHNQVDGFLIYVTYDENIDIWRKIGEINNRPEFILSIDYSIYTFHTNGNINFRFNVIEKEWREIADFTHLRKFYGIVQLKGFIYALGGISIHTGEQINTVEIYDPMDDTWLNVSPMIPVYAFHAIAFKHKIYVVGNNRNLWGFEMTAQAYDERSDQWDAVASPTIYRFNFSLVTYRERIYAIGGKNEEEYLKSVEVFDPMTEEWETFKDLPHVYYFPQSVVLNNQLIVYDNHLEDRSYLKTNPAVLWDEVLQDWKLIEESSPMNSLHNYCLFTPDSKECINRISIDNRDPAQFTKSPFY